LCYYGRFRAKTQDEKIKIVTEGRAPRVTRFAGDTKSLIHASCGDHSGLLRPRASMTMAFASEWPWRSPSAETHLRMPANMTKNSCFCRNYTTPVLVKAEASPPS